MHYIAHLSKDRQLKKIISAQIPVSLRKRKNICVRLCASIMSQQLSTRVAEVIYGRFLDLYDGKEPTPAQILDTRPENLRGIGLSNAKVSYIQNVARFALEQGMEARHLGKMSDEEIINYLTQIKGVGRWTVEMLLMFTLGREDVFAVDDLGIQTAMQKIYAIETSDKKQLKQQMILRAQKWIPYRTYACMHLWRWKDGEK